MLIQYEITRFDLDAHEFHLRMRFAADSGSVHRLRMPAWIPGSYMVRDFARHVTAIAASDTHGAVVIRKIDKQTWELRPDGGEVCIEYRIYAFDLSVRTAYLDRTRAYFNGTSLFLWLDGETDAGWELMIGRPPEPRCADWRVATTLPAEAVDGDGFGRYAGQGFHRLVDHPVEIGIVEQAGFIAGGVPHEIAVSDGGVFDMDRLVRDLIPICNEHASMFGELPVDRYLFLTLATADGYGGLEHRDSTSLICKRADLPAAVLDKPDKGYRQLLGLCSHEYFHLWNVKRIRPAMLADADLSREAYTELLWAFEGITSYYDELALARSGVLTPQDYLDLFATTVSRVLRGAGRFRQSIAESSFDAWTKFYKQDENAPNAIVSYYAKGALIAFGLDLTLRQASGDRLCLDDLMRALWQRFGKTGKGVPERAIEDVVAELLGTPIDDFFVRYVYGTDEPPLAEWFAMLGIGYRARPASSASDQGGYRAEPPSGPSGASLGVRYTAEPTGLRITHVLADGCAQQAGLSAGDLLLAIDGEQVSDDNLAGLLARRVGQTVPVHYLRRGLMIKEGLSARNPPHDTCDLWLLDDAQLSPQTLARRRAWLSSSRRDDA